MSTRKYLRAGTVAQVLGISRGTVWLWVKKGKIKPVRPPFGGYYMFPVEEIESLCSQMGIPFQPQKVIPSEPAVPEVIPNKDITPYKWAWFAGIVDGEGSLNIHKHKRKDSKKPTVECDFSISNINKPLLEEAKKHFGGALNGPYKYVRYRQPYWQLAFCPSKILELLPELIPYLIAKRKQAELLLEAQQILHALIGGVPQSYKQRLLDIFNELRNLPNKRHVNEEKENLKNDMSPL